MRAFVSEMLFFLLFLIMYNDFYDHRLEELQLCFFQSATGDQW